MYKYINIASLSIFFISIYILYANWQCKKSKKELIPMGMLILIISYKIICIVESNNVEFIKNLNYINSIIIILFAMQLNSKYKKIKISSIIIFINYIVGIGYLVSILGNKVDDTYIRMATMYMLMTTLYLFSITYKLNKKMFYTTVQILYFVYLPLYIIVSNKYLLNIGIILDFISSIYIFINIFKVNINDIYNKKEKITSKLNRSNIAIKIHDEKLNVNKSISSIINANLEKKQNLLNLILDQSNRCVLIINEEGYILNEDDNFYKMWSEYKDNKYKISLKRFLNGSVQNKSEFISNLEKVNKTNEKVYGEFVGKDGRYFDCVYSPFFISSEKIGIICIITDITYKKKSELKIRENNTKYRKIVDNIPYSILLTDDNNILYNNKKNEDIDFYKKDIKNIIVESEIIGEFHYTCLNNKEVCLDIDRVSFEGNGDIKNLVVIKDMTEYKKLLKKVEYNKKRYETLVNIIPEGIYILNYENKMPIYANETFLDICKCQNIEEVDFDEIGRCIDITSGKNNDNIRFKRKNLKNKHGENIDIEVGGMLIDVNKRLKMIGIVRDITDQVKTELMEIEIEEKKREHKAKSDFFINMSHELKTPLNVMYSSNQLLEALYKDEILKRPQGEISKAVIIVKRYLCMLMGLIDNIIDLAKLESDFHEIERDYYNIVSISEDVVTDFNQCVENNINIVFDTQEEEIIVNIDPDDIEKIILILLSMVIRYSKKGSFIYVDLYNIKDKMIICIKNKESYDYEKYLSDSERKISDIALTVCKSIISLYNGSINIKKSSTKDIEVNIELPIRENIEKYNKRKKTRSDNFIYAEYTKMGNF